MIRLGIGCRCQVMGCRNGGYVGIGVVYGCFMTVCGVQAFVCLFNFSRFDATRGCLRCLNVRCSEVACIRHVLQCADVM